MDETPPQPVTHARPPISARRRRLFILLSILLPLVLLAVIETALRLCGFGGYPPTFRNVATLEGGSRLVVTDNPGPASYFFRNRSRPGTLHQTALVSPKPAGVFRIVLAGESAMKGFPQPRALASDSFLRAMLSDAWPERTVETINLGTTAVASYPVLGMLRESLRFEPDLVVIYIGNNEFFGAYGVASLHSAGRSPAALRVIRAFRSTAIAQAIDSLAKGSDATADKTLMEAMMGQSFIPTDDAARKDAATNLRVFVGEMVKACRTKGVPVIVCLPPVNERDLAPLGESDMTGLPESEKKITADLLESRTISDLESAARHAPRSASAQYRLGQAYAAVRRKADAEKALRAAVDLDTMPWRPPSSSVDAIRDAAVANGAEVCDLAGWFRVATPAGVAGFDLLDDHVHPSLEGQALVAREIVRTMTTMTGAVSVPKEAFDSLPAWEVYAERLGANEFDRYGVAHQMRVLGAIPFFKKTNPAMFERFDSICREIESRQDPDVLAAMREWQKPQTHKGEQRPITSMVGRVLVQKKEFARAEPLFRVAAASVSEYSSWNVEFIYFMLVCRERSKGSLDAADLTIAQKAIERGQLLLGQGRSDSGQAERFVGRLYQLRREFDKAIPFLATARDKLSGSDRVANDLALVESYMRTGRPDDARALIQNGIDHSGEFSGTYRQMMEAIQKK